MAFSVSIQSARAKQELRQAERALTDLTPAWRQIGEMMVRSVLENFRQGGRPSPWKPLAPSTLRHKRPGGKILIDTGKLMRSVAYEIDGAGVLIGTNEIYAATHQFGRDHIPARPFVLMQAADRRRARDIMDLYLASRMP